jgi:hypothetical protein
MNIKRLLFCSVLSLFISILSVNAQSIKHMKFMGIPIDGKASAFCNKLESKGFYKDTEDVPNALCYVGKFYGEDANVQVNYTHDTYTVYSVNVYIIKKTVLELYPILRDYLKGVEDKYKYERKVVNPQLYQYDYYIFDGFDPIGLIQTFIVDSNSVPTTQEAMLSISYVDIENYMNYENRKRNDI